MDRRIDSATKCAKSVRVTMAVGENCATKGNIERSPGQFFSYVAKESSRRHSRRFQFPPMALYREKCRARRTDPGRQTARRRAVVAGSPRLN